MYRATHSTTSAPCRRNSSGVMWNEGSVTLRSLARPRSTVASPIIPPGGGGGADGPPRVHEDPLIEGRAPCTERVEERRADGRARRKQLPRTEHAAWTPPGRPDPVALVEADNDRPSALAGPDPSRPDEPERLHLLPGDGRRHGRRTWPARRHRPPGPALRRRPPLQLRRLHLAGPPPGVRRQRLRRDPARSVGVGREAPGGQLRPGRRPHRPQRRASSPAWPAAPSAAYRTAMQGFADAGVLDTWYARLEVDESIGAASRRDPRSAPEEDPLGPGPRQPPSPAASWRRGRRGATGSAATRRCSSRCGSSTDRFPSDEVETGVAHVAGRLPEVPRPQPPGPPRPLPARGRRPEGGRRRQRGHPLLDHPLRGPRPRRSLVPPVEGAGPVGARGPPARQPVPASRAAGGRGPTAHAGQPGHLPRLDHRPGGPGVLRAPAPGRQALGQRRPHGPGGDAGSTPSSAAHTLARAHARSGDAVAIAAYLGLRDTFDRAVAEFAEAYAQQAVDDHARFLAAIDAGRLSAAIGLIRPARPCGSSAGRSSRARPGASRSPVGR